MDRCSCSPGCPAKSIQESVQGFLTLNFMIHFYALLDEFEWAVCSDFVANLTKFEK